MRGSVPAILLLGGTRGALPTPVVHWIDDSGLETIAVELTADVLAMCLRARPRLVLLDGRDPGRRELLWGTCRALKRDAFTAIIPVVAVVGGDEAAIRDALAAGADEILRDDVSAIELEGRLALAVRRSDRDIGVHPTTRLPGASTIEAEIGRRLASGEPFAVCYADLDHFKEFNDRYSFRHGDGVILLLSWLLRDFVKGTCRSEGFVGHIGGDDFIFVIPRAAVDEVCSAIIAHFDQLVPFQYSEQDRRAGYFFGKDRRGQLHRVPLMTVSIGVVTNERRTFASARQVSELATEMKGYAKTLAGSVYTVDRRTDGDVLAPPRPPRSISVIDES